MPLFLTKRLWNIHNLSRIQKGWFHQGGGGGYTTQILLGMCRGKVKKWARAPDELPVEREIEGRQELPGLRLAGALLTAAALPNALRSDWN